jgi:hypothetical protein
MRGMRVIIPQKSRQDVLHRLHTGNMGITKCRARARETVWWPGISQQIEEMVKRCEACIMEQPQRKEPLIPSEIPERPSQKVAVDLFYLNKEWFLVVTDYYSRKS